MAFNSPDDYLAIGRKEMLRLARAWGFTAYKLKDTELAKLLYRLQKKGAM